MLYENLQSLENKLEELKHNFKCRDSRIEYLIAENSKLKSEHYKDEEIKRISNELEDMKSNLRNGFPIYKEEILKIEEWLKDKHGFPTYKFTPTPLGIFGVLELWIGNKKVDELIFREP